MKNLPKVLMISVAVGIFGYGFGIYFNMAPLVMAGGMASLTLLYGILLNKEHRPTKEKGFFRNVGTKIPIILVLGVIIWFTAGHYGFPFWWQVEFVAFALVGLFFFIILDLKTMKVEKGEGHSIRRLIGTYALGSLLYITITAQLPQFSPEIELAKLNRPPVDLSGLAGPDGMCLSPTNASTATRCSGKATRTADPTWEPSKLDCIRRNILRTRF